MGNTAYVALGSPLTGHPVAGVCTPSSSGGNNGRSRRHGGVLPSPRRLPTRDSGCRSTAVTPMHGHTQKSAKTSAATPECIATRQLIHHARSRSMEDEAMPSSPLRSRRQLPSVCLSVDMDYELEGRDGIVYIDGTKMPRDGWYQRCFGCGLWTAESVCLGEFEVFRCRVCAREFRHRAASLGCPVPRPARRSGVTESTITSTSTQSTDAPGSSSQTSSHSHRPRRSNSGSNAAAGGGLARRSRAHAARRASANASHGGGPTPQAWSHRWGSQRRQGAAAAEPASSGDTDMSDACDARTAVQGGQILMLPGGEDTGIVLTGLVAKLRDMLMVAMPANNIEGSFAPRAAC